MRSPLIDVRQLTKAARLAGIALLAVQSACGSLSATTAATPSAAEACHPLQVQAKSMTLDVSDTPTAGFHLPPGTQPVGIIRDKDGTSVWLLGTGTNSVLHVLPDGNATQYQLQVSGLGLQLSQAPDGTVWAPEQFRDAIVAIATDGTARECSLPAKSLEPYSTSAAADGSVWVAEQRGGAIARLDNGRFTQFPIGVTGAKGMEVLAAADGGAWFTVDGAPVLGHVSARGQVERIDIGGSGTSIGLLQTPDNAVWVADFKGDRVVRVTPDRKLAVWNAPAGAKPQGLALGPAGVVWVTESGIDHLASVRGGTLEQSFKTGAWPDHLAITTDGWAWFTEYNQGRLGRVLLPAT